MSAPQSKLLAEKSPDRIFSSQRMGYYVAVVTTASNQQGLRRCPSRLTKRLVPGYEQYHFTVQRRGGSNERIYRFKLIDKLLREDCHLPHSEFYIGSEIVDELKATTLENGNGTAFDYLQQKNVTLELNPGAVLCAAARGGYAVPLPSDPGTAPKKKAKKKSTKKQQ